MVEDIALIRKQEQERIEDLRKKEEEKQREERRKAEKKKGGLWVRMTRSFGGKNSTNTTSAAAESRNRNRNRNSSGKNKTGWWFWEKNSKNSTNVTATTADSRNSKGSDKNRTSWWFWERDDQQEEGNANKPSNASFVEANANGTLLPNEPLDSAIILPDEWENDGEDIRDVTFDTDEAEGASHLDAAAYAGMNILEGDFALQQEAER